MTRVLFVAAAFILAGCADDFQSWTIAHGTQRDAAKVKQVLRAVASQAQLIDRSSEHRDAQTFAAYEKFGVYVVAHAERGDIRVALMLREWPYTHAFKETDRLLAPALSAAFGQRLSRDTWDVERTIVVY